MLEERGYSAAELKTIIGGNTPQQIGRKLQNYGIEYTTEGRGDNRIYTLEKITDPFKVFCITELGFAAQSNFTHLRHFMFHFFNDEYYMSMPDEVKERMMDGYDYHISRQTIAKYERRLRQKNYISMNGDYYYYFAHKGKLTMTKKERFLEAWHTYWDWRRLGADSRDAMGNVIITYGGVPRKQHKIEKNVFYLEKINFLIVLISESIEKDFK